MSSCLRHDHGIHLKDFLFSGLCLLNELDGVAYILDGLRLVIGNLDVELLLKFHDQLDGIKAISTQVLAKSG